MHITLKPMIIHKFLILLAFVAVNFLGYCDTLDYYHVYLNDSLIGKYNSLSKQPSITLIESELNDSDVITVRYGTDHPCFECVYVLTAFAEIKAQIPSATTNEQFGKLSIPMKDLIYFNKLLGVDSFHFLYSIKTNGQFENRATHLFTLKIR